MECLAADILVQYVGGNLPALDHNEASTHLDQCMGCRKIVSTLALESETSVSGTEDGVQQPLSVQAGQSFGRYVVLHQIGRGGSATVFAAYDPELDRKVALKVLSTQGQSGHRLLREGRTLAKLTHPHIVAIYDVGIEHDVLYLAMEYVEGKNFRQWLWSQPTKPSWPELRGIFVEAGRALAFAHSRGLIHRDIKPENLLIDKSGAVRVSDFGLAVVTAANRDEERLEHRWRALVGTPTYMAPEQLRGETASPASDQFNFCATLLEALCGQRPKDGISWQDLATRANPVVPRRVAHALARGLAALPAERHRSMEHVVAALADQPSKLGRWPVLAGAISAALGLGLALLTVLSGREEDPRRKALTMCQSAKQRASQLWNPSSALALQKAFTMSGRSNAKQVSATVNAALDAYLAAWSHMAMTSCERTHVYGDQSAELLDKRTWCLDLRLVSAQAVIDELLLGDASVVDNAAMAVSGLPSITACEAQAVSAQMPLPRDPKTAAAVNQMQKQVEVATALQLVGKYQQAWEQISGLVTPARAIAYSPLLSQILYVVGDLQYHRGELKESTTTLFEAAELAAKAQDDAHAAKVWTLLGGVVGYAQGKIDEGLILAKTADAWLVRAGKPAAAEAELADVRGLLLDVKGQTSEARQFYERALKLREQLYGPDHLLVALSLNNLAGIPHQQGDWKTARELHQRALTIRLDKLGESSVDVAVSINALASIAEHVGQLEEAESGYRKALGIWQAILGPDHADTAAAHNNLGNLLRVRGDLPGSERELSQAFAIWQKTLGDEHPHTTSALGNLAIVQYEKNDYPQAIATFGKVLELRQKTLGPSHQNVAHVLVNRGQAYEKLSQNDLAETDFLAALQIFEKTLNKQDPTLAWALTILGKFQLAQKQVASAVGSLKRAVRILEHDEQDSAKPLAAARFALARGMWQAGERKKSIGLANLARQALSDRESLTVIDAWLAQHKHKEAR